MRQLNQISLRTVSSVTVALALCAWISLGGCAHQEDISAQAMPERQAVKLDAQSGADMNQIASTSGNLLRQIPTTSSQPQLTMEQLRVYADRCQPSSPVAPPPGLDCSEIRLRMQRVFRTEDKVTEALITLGELGRSDSKSVANDLNDGYTDGSFAAQAIAGGLTDPAPPPAPEEDSFQDFLDANGLGVSAGAIVAKTGG